MIKALVVIGAVALAGCDGFVGEVAVAPTQQLPSTWSLATVDNDVPARVNIKSWQLSIDNDGNWSYSGEMQGQWAGMQLKGDGRWKVVSPGKIEYTAGDNSGTLTYRVTNDMLTLSPDPVIAKPGGVGSAVTTYSRVDRTY